MRKPAFPLVFVAASLLIALAAGWIWSTRPGTAPVITFAPEPANSGVPAPSAPPPLETPISQPLASAPSPQGSAATWTAEQFGALTEQTLRELPTANDLKNLSTEEAHDYPEPLARAGAPLGRIAQAVNDQPSLKPQATRFYSDCARSEAIVVPVRALCYSHVMEDPQAPPAESLPAEVIRLAKLIPVE